MLTTAMKSEGITQADLARGLGMAPSLVSMKISGRRPWRAQEMATVKRFISEAAGREYTVDELFFSEAGAA